MNQQGALVHQHTHTKTHTHSHKKKQVVEGVCAAVLFPFFFCFLLFFPCFLFFYFISA